MRLSETDFIPSNALQQQIGTPLVAMQRDELLQKLHLGQRDKKGQMQCSNISLGSIIFSAFLLFASMHRRRITMMETNGARITGLMNVHA